MKIMVEKKSLLELKVDAIVNPANSSGKMGGGVAGAIKKMGGEQIEKEAMAQAPIAVGEAVLTSGLDRVFPRGLLVGYVAEVTQGDLELRVILNLSAPLDRVSAVLLLPPQPPVEVQPPLLAPDVKPAKKRGTP